MKKCNFTILAAIMLSASGCIQEAPLNAEADILEVTLQEIIEIEKEKEEAQKNGTYFEEKPLLIADPVVTNDEVTFIAHPKNLQDRSSLTPVFSVTSGAVISPASGTTLDFTEPQQYTVTSEDGKWTKTYTVSVVEGNFPLVYDFELWEDRAGGRYEEPYNIISYEKNGRTITETHRIWSSGNGGFAVAASGQPKENYPTQSTTNSVAGNKAVKLETKATGYEPLPIAAGNLFIGEFIARNAMKDPLTATRFGRPVNQKPLVFKGFYKYKPGEKFQDENGKILEGVVDECHIYAVLYENVNGETLDGRNVLTDERIVGLAFLDNVITLGSNDDIESAQYNYFEIEMEYRKEVDYDRLENYGYNMAVVFSSSSKGDLFQGAIGSTMYIDEVEVVCE